MLIVKINQVKLALGENEDKLQSKCEKLLKCKIKKIEILKKSIDARDKSNIYFSYSVIATLFSNSNVNFSSNVVKYTHVDYAFPIKCNTTRKIVIVGTGPAGLFAGLVLAQNGYNPILVDRGEDVEKRTKSVNDFWMGLGLKDNSNVQFGEGGAGTFSDGKLTTGIKDLRIRKVLEEFVAFGAPKNILYENKPHVGTDYLKNIVSNIRKEIIRLGGMVYFNTRLVNLEIDDNRVFGVALKNEEKEFVVNCDSVILAIGHSARDTFSMLYENGIKMEQKPFSVGVRIEHPSSLINFSQYGKSYEKLGAADYKMAVHLPNGKSLYTFCMCPGGYVINSSSERGGIVVNGMSNQLREGENSNSALLVPVSNLDNNSVFGGINFQRDLEAKAYSAGGGDYSVPIQCLGDFFNGVKSTTIGKVTPTIKPKFKPSNMYDILPEELCDTLKSGIILMNRKLKGFAMGDAILTAVETRSSSPIKIIRDDRCQTNIEGIYVCGEGGGHAGGITSSAVDGIRAAEWVSQKI